MGCAASHTALLKVAGRGAIDVFLSDRNDSALGAATRAAYVSAMRFALILSAAALVGGLMSPTIAAKRRPSHQTEATPAAGPTEIGSFGDWTAARYQRGGEMVCYAFTRARSSHPPASGNQPLLTVTERSHSRDEVAIATDNAYPKSTDVTVQIGQTGLDFYTVGNDAFARDGQAAVVAMRKGDQAIARGPGPHGASAIDIFGLAGFTAAYDAVTKACPSR